MTRTDTVTTRALRCGALVAVTAVFLAACSTGAPATQPVPGAGLEGAELIGYYGTLAESNGAGQPQIDVLRAAEQSGELTFEAVSALVEASFACMAEAGISHEEQAPREIVSGRLKPVYNFSATAEGMTEDEVLDAADACLDEHSFWAEMALGDPRLYRDELDAELRAQLPTVLACLTENDVEVPADAELDEVRQASLDLALATDEASGGDEMIICTRQEPFAQQ